MLNHLQRHHGQIVELRRVTHEVLHGQLHRLQYSAGCGIRFPVQRLQDAVHAKLLVLPIRGLLNAVGVE